MLSEDCPEARYLLAVSTEDPDESRRLLEQALLDAKELLGAALELLDPRGEMIECKYVA